jgi:glycosyltransferase involved in cell wall biosynthesis
MKIAHFGLHYLPIPADFGGAIEKRIYELCKRLAKNHDVHVFSVGNKKHELLMDNVKYHYVPYKGKVPAYDFFWKLALHSKKYDFDVIHLHANSISSLYTKMLGSEAKTLVSVDYPHIGPRSKIWIVDSFFTLLSLKSIDKFLFVSNYARKVFKRKYNIPANKTDILYNGVDTEKYIYSKEIRETYRTKYNLQNNFVILFVGRICKQKGVHVLLKSYKSLKRKYPELKLLLVGPAGGEFHKTKISSFAAEILYSLKKLNGLYLGQISEKDLIGVYNACDLFVLPTLELEMFGMVLIEAMACERPVIATAHGGIPEVIGGVGTLVKPGDDKALSKAIEDNINVTPNVYALRKKALSFSWDTIYEKLRMIYNNLAYGNRMEA